MVRPATSRNKKTAPGAPPPGVLTFQRHPLLQIRDEDPSCDATLEILLRPDGVRIAVYVLYENEGVSRSLSVYVSPTDFEAFVESARAHHFEASAPDNKPPNDVALKENPLLQLVSESLDRSNYLEILLRPDGVSFALTANDHEGFAYEHVVRISPTSFEALVARCRTHRFGGKE